MADCNKCAEAREEKKANTVPYTACKIKQAQSERHSKWWKIAFFVALAMMFTSNIAWLFAVI